MAVVDFFGCEWMDVGGVWEEGGKGGVLGWKVEGKLSWLLFWMVGFGIGMIWLLLLLLLLRVGTVRIIILMYSYYQSA